VVVIASEAKQSIEQQERKLDCFASLAMTVKLLRDRCLKIESESADPDPPL
jgi:hypothetical protein